MKQKKKKRMGLAKAMLVVQKYGGYLWSDLEENQRKYLLQARTVIARVEKTI